MLVGMFYGFVFTFIPLLVAWQATRKAVSWPWKIAIVLVAVAIATPNLLTAGIVFGSTESAHAGQRTLSVDAGFFTTWTAISAVAAVVVFAAVTILWALWRRRGGKQMKVLKQAENHRTRLRKMPKHKRRTPHPAPRTQEARHGISMAGFFVLRPCFVVQRQATVASRGSRSTSGVTAGAATPPLRFAAAAAAAASMTSSAATVIPAPARWARCSRGRR